MQSHDTRSAYLHTQPMYGYLLIQIFINPVYMPTFKFRKTHTQPGVSFNGNNRTKLVQQEGGEKNKRGTRTEDKGGGMK